MNFRIPVIALTAMLATSHAAQAQQKYDIKLKKSAKGDVYLVEKSEDQETQTVIKDGEGKALKEDKKRSIESYSFRETILEKAENDRYATKVLRQYSKAEVTADDNTTKLPYHGKSVLIEKKDGKYRFQIEGGQELVGPDAEKLDKEFSKKKDDDVDLEKLVLPGRPVAVGETWKIATAPLVADLERSGGFVPDAAKMTATVKLLKAYEMDGRQFGVLQIDIIIPIKALGTKDNMIPLDADSQMTIRGDMNLCIDGSANINSGGGKIGASVSFQVPDQPQLRAVVQNRSTMTEVRKLAPK